MKKALKKQIKQDELVTGYERARNWVLAHADQVKMTGIVLAVVAIGATALVTFRSQRTRAAERAFSEALEIFRAPVKSEQADGAAPAAGAYETAAEKHKKALAAFEGVDRRYGSLRVGLRARYYGALSRIELGQLAEAEKVLGEIAGNRGQAPIEAALARLALADLHRRKGEIDKAAEAYRRIVDDAQSPLPRDHALMSLASTLEEARRTNEAAAAYRRLADDFPLSSFAGEAQRKADYLRSLEQS